MAYNPAFSFHEPTNHVISAIKNVITACQFATGMLQSYNLQLSIAAAGSDRHQRWLTQKSFCLSVSEGEDQQSAASASVGQLDKGCDVANNLYVIVMLCRMRAERTTCPSEHWIGLDIAEGKKQRMPRPASQRLPASDQITFTYSFLRNIGILRFLFWCWCLFVVFFVYLILLINLSVVS